MWLLREALCRAETLKPSSCRGKLAALLPTAPKVTWDWMDSTLRQREEGEGTGAEEGRPGAAHLLPLLLLLLLLLHPVALLQLSEEL